MEIKLKSIGVVHSPFKKKEDIETEKFAHPEGFDSIEGTPILDIKPYTPRDQKSSIKYGWLEDKIKKK